MDLLIYILVFCGSLAMLVKASDYFVDSAEVIGISMGISPFIVGVTIVAFGTSLPELATSIAAVFENSSEIVIGNVVGSNITNILLVLGITAVVAKDIVLDFDVMDTDMPLLIASALFLYFVVSDLQISIVEALFLLVAMVIFLLKSIKASKDSDAERTKASTRSYIIVIVASAMVYLGAYLTIYAIKNISVIAGIPTEVIALTAVALGTSLPEVVVSIAAARKGKTAIAVGNVLGSNIFNTFAIMGIPALIKPLIIPESILSFSLPMMVGVTILFAFICFSSRISRWEGWMLILIYGIFVYNSFA